MTTGRQQEIDAGNADFWTELCGSNLAQTVGVTDASPSSLERFDQAYLELYPYLERYLPWHNGQRTLEVGLGYGTVGSLLAKRGLDYHGLDISPGPVAMMAHRLKQLGMAPKVTQGSALAIPHPDESFDVVVSIGCLHHTGDLARAVSEVQRVLRPGGQATVMVYNSRSYLRLVTLPLRVLTSGAWRRPHEWGEIVRGAYDANSRGAVAPTTQFATAAQMRHLFAPCDSVSVRCENNNSLVIGILGRYLVVRRERLLSSVGRLAGLDLYVSATK